MKFLLTVILVAVGFWAGRASADQPAGHAWAAINCPAIVLTPDLAAASVECLSREAHKNMAFTVAVYSSGKTAITYGEIASQINRWFEGPRCDIALISLDAPLPVLSRNSPLATLCEGVA